jgi:hypothetical protein
MNSTGLESASPGVNTDAAGSTESVRTSATVSSEAVTTAASAEAASHTEGAVRVAPVAAVSFGASGASSGAPVTEAKLSDIGVSDAPGSAPAAAAVPKETPAATQGSSADAAQAQAQAATIADLDGKSIESVADEAAASKTSSSQQSGSNTVASSGKGNRAVSVAQQPPALVDKLSNVQPGAVAGAMQAAVVKSAATRSLIRRLDSVDIADVSTQGMLAALGALSRLAPDVRDASADAFVRQALESGVRDPPCSSCQCAFKLTP